MDQRGRKTAPKAPSGPVRRDVSEKASSRSTDGSKSAKSEPKDKKEAANKIDKNLPEKKTVKTTSTKTENSKKSASSGKEVSKGPPAKPKGSGAPRKGARRGRGGKRRKPKISPEERRRRELKTWLSVREHMLATRATLTRPPPPFFIQRERELLAERRAEHREKTLAEAAKGARKAKSKSQLEHDDTVRRRYVQLRVKQQQGALEADQKLQRRFDELEKQRNLRVRAHQQKVYEQRMREIKLAEERKKNEKLRRQEEERVVRILNSKK